MIKIKRIYDQLAQGDGKRILVDRLWPRGIREKKAVISEWLKDIAPSNELRKRFLHDPTKWNEFILEVHDHINNTTIKSIALGFTIILIGIALSIPGIAGAHYDTLAGPVVTDARKALWKGDVAPVLKWVKKEHEGEIKEAFNKTLAARNQGKEAKELADMYFFRHW